jgi:hypothetical protein
MNKEQQELLDGAYENYLKGGHIKWLNQMEVNTPAGKMNIPVPYTQEEFINKCKTDTEFSQRWGLKIEQRELTTVRERKKYDIHFDDLFGEYPDHHETLDKRGVPRKLITITYNDKTIEMFLP